MRGREQLIATQASPSSEAYSGRLRQNVRSSEATRYPRPKPTAVPMKTERVQFVDSVARTVAISLVSAGDMVFASETATSTSTAVSASAESFLVVVVLLVVVLELLLAAAAVLGLLAAAAVLGLLAAAAAVLVFAFAAAASIAFRTSVGR